MAEARKRATRPVRWRRVMIRVGQVLGSILLVGVVTAGILACFAAVYIRSVILPQATLDLRDVVPNLTSTIYYTDPETGREVEYLTLHGDENRVWIPYSEIPQNLINATVAGEDKRFYSHKGVDWIRTGASVLTMLTGGTIEGGSTITQQLIKNTTGYDDVTVKRKVIEIFKALEFDRRYSKETTLEWYLNYVFFGEGCNGVYTASYAYFGKPVSELTLAECASLISITNNPSRYSPYLNADKNKERQEWVLRMMAQQGYITEEERAAAVAQPLVFQRGVDEDRPTAVYTWFQDKVIQDVISDLMEKYSWSAEVAARVVYSGGIQIHTTFDPRAQAIVDEVYGTLDSLPYISNSGQQMQSGIAVIDATGNLVAVAGGVGPKTESRSWSRATDTVRPPGSAIKPLTVYGPALEMGLITPYTVLEDVPYQIEAGNAWPVNAYGYYNGRMNVMAGVEVSSNPMAVRVLGDYVTPEVSFQFLRERFRVNRGLVVERWANDKKFTDIGLAQLGLGGLTDGVSVYEMAAAYSVFPRMGKYIEPRSYTKVTDTDGKEILLDNTQETDFILKESTAYYMNALLKNVVSSGTGTAARFSDMSIAGKTGTTSSRRDRWFVGYTPYYTAAVWCGYDQQERMDYSGNPPAALWKAVMQKLHEGLENKDFPRPGDAELVTAPYCLDSGMIPTEACSLDARGARVGTGTFARGDAPVTYCTMHEVIEVCTASPLLTDGGEETGMYHLAGANCPEDTRKQVALLQFERERVTPNVSARDDAYLLEYYRARGGADGCTVHLKPAFDPQNPASWPDDPDFDILDQTTWPGYVAPEPSDPSDPDSDPDTEPEPEPDPLPTEPDPVETPPDEPFIPVGDE